MYGLYADFQQKLCLSTRMKPYTLGTKITTRLCYSDIGRFRLKQYHLAQDSESKILERFNFCFRNGSENKTKTKV